MSSSATTASNKYFFSLLQRSNLSPTASKKHNKHFTRLANAYNITGDTYTAFKTSKTILW